MWSCFHPIWHSKIAVIRAHEKAFWELFDRWDIKNFRVFLRLGDECVLNVLLKLKSINNETFSFWCRGNHLFFVQPEMFRIVMILRYLSKLRKGFECALLKPPHLPMAVTRSDNLIVVPWIEGKASYTLIVSLLRKIIMSYYSTLNCVVMFRGLLSCWLNPRIYESFHITVSIWVWLNQHTHIFRVMGKPHRKNVLLGRAKCSVLVMRVVCR